MMLAALQVEAMSFGREPIMSSGSLCGGGTTVVLSMLPSWVGGEWHDAYGNLEHCM